LNGSLRAGAALLVMEEEAEEEARLRERTFRREKLSPMEQAR
jgi:hypothetical protein